MPRMIYAVALLFLVFLVASGTAIPKAQASATPEQIFYVAPTGNDNDPGTEAQPWKTLQKAVETLTAGQTVLVKDGTYYGMLEMNHSGEPEQPITLRAFPGAKPVIEINEAFDEGIIVRGVSYITIDGFELVYTAPGAEQANGERYENGISIESVMDGSTPLLPHHITITNNRVHGFPGGGIGSGLADYITVEGNIVWENALWSKYNNSGISLYQSVDFDLEAGFHNIIRGNTVFKNENRVPGTGIGNTTITDGNCIIIDDSRQTQKFLANKTQYPAYQSATLIENNICAGNGGRGVHIFLSDNVLVRHNTLYQNLQTPDIGGGELTANSSSNIHFVNNIVYTTLGQRATDLYEASDIVFENNLYFNTTDISNKSPSDLVADPLFEYASINLNEANFKLKLGSPAIDNALATQSPTTDVGGGQRPQGAGPDIGAWEFR
jgi:parallel beta-helix repeat protein